MENHKPMLIDGLNLKDRGKELTEKEVMEEYCVAVFKKDKISIHKQCSKCKACWKKEWKDE